MKNFYVFTIVMLSLLVSSCGKGNEESVLTGEWGLVSLTEKGKDISEPCHEYNYIVFSEKKLVTYDACSGGFREYPYTISDNHIIVQTEEGEIKFLYTIKGDELTMTNRELVFTYKKNARKVMPDNPFVGMWGFQSRMKNGVNISELCDEYQYVNFLEKKAVFHNFTKDCVEEIRESFYSFSGNNIVIEDGKGIQKATFAINGDFLMITIDGEITTYKKNTRKVKPDNLFIGEWKIESSFINENQETISYCMGKTTLNITDKEIISNNYFGKAGNCKKETDVHTYSFQGNEIVNIRNKQTGELHDKITISIERGRLIIRNDSHEIHSKMIFARIKK